ncbi:MAG: hypothetical protein M4D80_34510 [Myxococcota bacterium]|nr:hypothetical protein [Deltaproteobacteria bacterium]MDQ3340300.1 hypothetical protein [Myxococcota bacterium]
MLTRRVFGMVLASLVASRAFGGKRKPELWSGEILAKAEKGSIVVGDRHIRLRNRATPKELVMLSASNDNQTFTLWVVLPLQHEGDYQYVRVDNNWWSSQGTGRDSKQTTTSFVLDRAAALRIAKAFGLPIHERTKLDEGLRYSWRFPPKASMDKTAPIPVVLRIENAGKRTVGVTLGGRQRGARDNQFVFVISRNGKPVAIKDAPDFGGISTISPLEPGKHLERTCADLRAWADLDLPGYYTLEARFETALSKDGTFPTTAAERAQTWDIAAIGQGSILVQ